MGSKTPLRLAAEKLLTPEWQPTEGLIATLSHQVPPGKAYRSYAAYWESCVRRGTVPENEPDEDFKIRSGQRMLVNKVFGSMASSGEVEIRRNPFSNEREIRTTEKFSPGMPEKKPRKRSRPQKTVRSSSDVLLELQDDVIAIVDRVLSGTDREHHIPLSYLMTTNAERKELANVLALAILARAEQHIVQKEQPSVTNDPGHSTEGHEPGVSGSD